MHAGQSHTAPLGDYPAGDWRGRRHGGPQFLVVLLCVASVARGPVPHRAHNQNVKWEEEWIPCPPPWMTAEISERFPLARLRDLKNPLGVTVNPKMLFTICQALVQEGHLGGTLALDLGCSREKLKFKIKFKFKNSSFSARKTSNFHASSYLLQQFLFILSCLVWFSFQLGKIRNYLKNACWGRQMSLGGGGDNCQTGCHLAACLCPDWTRPRWPDSR